MPHDLFANSPMYNAQLSETNFQNVSCLEKKYPLSLNMNIPYANNSPIQQSFIDRVYGPTKVEYVSKEEDLKEGIMVFDSNNSQAVTIHLNLIGQRKIDSWSFEKEYRFRLFFNNGILIPTNRNLLEVLIDLNLSTKFIDIKFKKESLEGIEILLGPKTDEKYREEFNVILNQLGIKSFSIKRSKILIN